MLDTLGGVILTANGTDAIVEEELELEDPLGGRHILVGRDAADRRLVHPDLAGNLLGIQLGPDAIPERWLESLELREVIEQLAAVIDDPNGGPSIVDADRARLEALELVPFRRAVAEGVDAVMTAHVAVPEVLGAGGPPATLSPFLLMTG